MATSVDDPYKQTSGRMIAMKGIAQAGKTSPLVALAAGRAAALGQQAGQAGPVSKVKDASVTNPPTIAKAKADTLKKMPSITKRTSTPKASAVGAAPKHLTALLGMIAKQQKASLGKAVKVTKAKSVSVKKITASSV